MTSLAIVLNSDSTYMDQRTSEGSSITTVGTWKLINDSVELMPLTNKELPLVSSVELSKKASGSSSSFFIFDKTGKPMSKFVILPKGKNKENNLPPHIVSADRKYQTDSNGFITIRKNEFDTLAFPQLEAIGNRIFRVSTNKLSDTVKVYLNINREWLSYSHLSYYYAERESIKLKMDNGRLSYGDCILN